MFDPTLKNLQSVTRLREDGVRPASLEKDSHLLQIFNLLNNFGKNYSMRFVFIVGTSLSKRGLIARFLENADFLAVPTLLKIKLNLENIVS